MAEPLLLSVVDQAPVRKGGTAAEALRECVELAVAAERLGYARFWIAEHHNLPSLAATSPEILIGQVAAHTQRIRVGSGGVMLTHYSALKVAEQFRTLESMFPGRIDLGLGRAPGGDPRTAAALAWPSGVRDVRQYPEQVEDLLAWLGDGPAQGHRFAGVRAGPPAAGTPEVWLLGSALDSALLAAERGLPFSFAHFFGTAVEHGPAIANAYRERFRPSDQLATPRLNVAVSVICAETADEARHHASSMKLSRLNLARGLHIGIVPPEEALAHAYTPEELAFLEQSARSGIEGDPAQVRDALEEIAARYGTRDLSVVTICHDFDARVRSYELVARVCGIAPGADPRAGGVAT